ncbi:potassium channel family protein [uncultured Modestobacter sp.]|uniref:potassium channel family protein n=1 Tax=uncultured Modestobacter sp. TaxID=380048 RepID=UPI00260F726E|nr:potassium channel family protein [uncultured Modestobacter sp.]
MNWFVTAAGAGIVLFAVRDMFHTIWHPSGQGTLSRLVFRMVWRGSRLLKRRAEQSSVVGPVALLSVILTWAIAIVAGWTLVYWPHMTEAFSFGSTLDPAQRSDFLDSLYLSLVTVATLGYGDIVPQQPWLRLTSPVQALIGFALLTAAVSWVMQIYPALARRRALAIRLTLLERAGAAQLLPAADSSSSATLLHSLTGELAQVRVDLTQYAETYYFRETDAAASLPAKLPYAGELARAGQESAPAELRLAGTVLAEAVQDYAHLLAQQFPLAGDSTDDVLQNYATDHGYTRP